MENFREEIQEIKAGVSRNAENIARINGKIDVIVSNDAKVNELLALIEQVKSAMVIFVKVGNVIKWVLGFIAPVVAAYYAIKTGMNHK